MAREVLNNLDQSYWAIVRRQFKKNKLATWSLRVLYLIIFVGVTADFIANERPYHCVIKGQTYFPLLRGVAVDLGLSDWPEELSNVDWRKLEYEKVTWAPIPYSPTTLDFENHDYVSPFDEQKIESGRWKHLLGTDNLGRDVMAGMIHGTRVAMLVGVISMSVAFIIGIFFGSLAGYLGDNRLSVSRIRIVMNILFVPIALFYSFGIRSYAISDALSQETGNPFMGFMWQMIICLFMFAAVMVVANIVTYLFKFIPFLRKKVIVPVDIVLSRVIEVLESIPTFLLILSIVAVIEKPAIYYIMVIIGLTSWTGIARYIRAELLKVRNLEYIEAAQALGFPEWRTILKHAIPNALTSVLISVSFGIASAILTESSLSFLGIGVPAEQVTWGSMISLARGFPQAWWIAIFPGIAIFITVTIFNLIGDGLAEAMDPKSKQ